MSRRRRIYVLNDWLGFVLGLVGQVAGVAVFYGWRPFSMWHVVGFLFVAVSSLVMSRAADGLERAL